MRHPIAELVLLDTRNPNSGQPEQHRRTVTQARGLSGLLPRNSQTSRGHGFLTAGALSTARNRRCPVKIEEPVYGRAIDGVHRGRAWQPRDVLCEVLPPAPGRARFVGPVWPGGGSGVELVSTRRGVAVTSTQPLTNVDLATVRELGAQLRVDSIRSSTSAGSGHPTSSMSAADILAVLVARHLRYDWDHPAADDNTT